MLNYIGIYFLVGLVIFTLVFTNIKRSKEILPLHFRLLPILVATAWPIILLSLAYDITSKIFTVSAERLIKFTYKPRFKSGDIVKFKETNSLSRIYVFNTLPPNTFLTVKESSVNLYGDTTVKLLGSPSGQDIHADEDELEIVSEEEVVLYGK